VPSLYLDTSMLGGYFDDEWKEATLELWRQMEAGQWRFFTSVVAVEELATAPERVRELFRRSFTPETVFDVRDEMDQLAAAYVAQAVVTLKYADDARHVAACTVARHDYLVSWNFRHLVNVQRSAGFNAVNLLQGYPPVRIVNPLELIYGTEDENL
jgi:predicted nucleic acid-binding protein